MAKAPKQPISPTVSAVFAGFLKKLGEDGTVEKVAVDRLQKVLDDQDFDSESFGSALFDAKVL